MSEQKLLNSLEAALLQRGVQVKLLYMGQAGSGVWDRDTELDGLQVFVAFPCQDDMTGEPYIEESYVVAVHGKTYVSILKKWFTKDRSKASDYFDTLSDWVDDNEAQNQLRNWEMMGRMLHAFFESNEMI